MNRVFVLSKTGKALMPCHPARARQLKKKKKARVKRLYPFTIQLTQRSDGFKTGDIVKAVVLKGKKKRNI